MTEPKFTPGPWKVIESGVVAEGRFVIARIYLDPLKEENAAIEESVANAHLIAAAPELYEALETCLLYGAMTGDDWVIFKAETALAKARGESHD